MREVQALNLRSSNASGAIERVDGRRRTEVADERVGVDGLEVADGVVAHVPDFEGHVAAYLTLHAERPLLRVGVVEGIAHRGEVAEARVGRRREVRRVSRTRLITVEQRTSRD